MIAATKETFSAHVESLAKQGEDEKLFILLRKLESERNALLKLQERSDEDSQRLNEVTEQFSIVASALTSFGWIAE